MNLGLQLNGRFTFKEQVPVSLGGIATRSNADLNARVGYSINQNRERIDSSRKARRNRKSAYTGSKIHQRYFVVLTKSSTCLDSTHDEWSDTGCSFVEAGCVHIPRYEEHTSGWMGCNTPDHRYNTQDGEKTRCSRVAGGTISPVTPRRSEIWVDSVWSTRSHCTCVRGVTDASVQSMKR